MVSPVLHAAGLMQFTCSETILTVRNMVAAGHKAGKILSYVETCGKDDKNPARKTDSWKLHSVINRLMTVIRFWVNTGPFQAGDNSQKSIDA